MSKTSSTFDWLFDPAKKNQQNKIKMLTMSDDDDALINNQTDTTIRWLCINVTLVSSTIGQQFIRKKRSSRAEQSGTLYRSNLQLLLSHTKSCVVTVSRNFSLCPTSCIVALIYWLIVQKKKHSHTANHLVISIDRVCVCVVFMLAFGFSFVVVRGDVGICTIIISRDRHIIIINHVFPNNFIFSYITARHTKIINMISACHLSSDGMNIYIPQLNSLATVS